MTPGEKSLLLLVDDNETSRYTKTRILRQAGFDVVEAATGADGLRIIRERSPRLVVLDVKLPDMDGWEVCRHIKENRETNSVLVLQTSATFVSDADTVRALETGADGCLTEPIEPPVLVATVRALLRARLAEDALRDALSREQAARASAEAANRTKDEFLATLSHELRSPLSAVLTWVGLLRSGRLDQPRALHAYEAIERSARLQMRLIDDLLDVSRIMSGKMILDVVTLDLADTVEATVESVRAAAEAKGVQLVSTVEPGVGPLSGDAARLQQVVWNLLNNAVKFTPRGGRVELRVERVDGEVRLTVADTGQGIDPAFLPHIFERFRQADSSSTRPHDGLGLGLAIVRYIVELHGGSVDAQSEGLGKGTTMTVRLPVRDARSLGRPDQVAPKPKRIPMPTIAGLRILVVEDERDARDAIATVLELCGAEVTAVASVADAVASLAKERPDAIVSDIAMPAEDGFALIRQLRRDAGGGGGVRALALTAYASADDQRRILAAGFDAYMTKPIDATELVATVARLARS